MVALQEKKGLFDSVKRLERARQADTYDALTVEQRESLSFNLAIVLLRLNRSEQCQKVLEELKKVSNLLIVFSWFLKPLIYRSFPSRP
jgi:hypothetical protein